MSNLLSAVGTNPDAVRPAAPAVRPSVVRLSPVVVGVTLPVAMPDHAALEAYTLDIIGKLCGGATIGRGEGAYIMQSGSLAGQVVREAHTRVWGFLPADYDQTEIIAALDELAGYLLANSSEECVLIEYPDGPGLAFRPDLGVSA